MKSIGHRSCEIIMTEKTPLSHAVVCFQMLDFKNSSSLNPRSRNLLRGKLLLSWKLRRQRGAVSHNVLNYQQLPITRYQVRFYVNNYFEYVPIVSTAFQIWGKFATHNHESVKFKRRRQDGSLWQNVIALF